MNKLIYKHGDIDLISTAEQIARYAHKDQKENLVESLIYV